MKTKAFMTMAGLALLLAAAGPALAEDGTGLEELAVGLATTPAHHAALASYFQDKAADARAEVARHEAMKRAYSGGSLKRREDMRKHCDGLIAQLGAAAAEYDALAAEHNALAK